MRAVLRKLHMGFAVLLQLKSSAFLQTVLMVNCKRLWLATTALARNIFKLFNFASYSRLLEMPLTQSHQNEDQVNLNVHIYLLD
jgi:hypothetical protein